MQPMNEEKGERKGTEEIRRGTQRDDRPWSLGSEEMRGFFKPVSNGDPASSALERPLRLPSGSVWARISHPQAQPLGSIAVSVTSAAPLSSEDEQALLDQVSRMLRISDYNDRLIQEFHRIHADSRERGFGRVFRSPTLFEDMVKCILLCNCQWPRTLSMAKALCELQLQVKHGCNPEGSHLKKSQKIQKRKSRKRKKVAPKLETIITGNGNGLLETPESVNNHNAQLKDTQGCHSLNPSQSFNDTLKYSDDGLSYSEIIGHFPSPEELAVLDVAFLANRCKLGYRSQHIISLAQSIVNGNVQLRKLEELCVGYSLSSYESMDERLSSLGGFGPFTRANVLMCMGFYHRIPADKETFRHIRQVCFFNFLSNIRRIFIRNAL